MTFRSVIRKYYAIVILILLDFKYSSDGKKKLFVCSAQDHTYDMLTINMKSSKTKLTDSIPHGANEVTVLHKIKFVTLLDTRKGHDWLQLFVINVLFFMKISYIFYVFCSPKSAKLLIFKTILHVCCCFLVFRSF